MSAKPRHRGAISKHKNESKPVLVYFPRELIPLIDQAVQLTDSDRSKFIRQSVRRELSNLQLTPAAA